MEMTCKKKITKLVFAICGIYLYFSCFGNTLGNTWVKGIYVTQPTLESTQRLKTLIRRAKAAGINTFVIDLQYFSKRYRRNIKLVHDNGLRYVVRIVVFPRGGKRGQVTSKIHWEKKYKLIQEAIRLGAKEVQLDYIRYYVGYPASSQNARDIHNVIKWYKSRLQQQGIPLQIAVFGETSFGESRSIGQNVKLFSESVDVVNPMTYPSHYEPFRMHAKQPYQTVFSSLQALQNQFPAGKAPFLVYPYIELYNYRYPLSHQAKLNYIHAQIKAVEDSHSDGWYAWSPRNKYNNLFRVLQAYPVR